MHGASGACVSGMHEISKSVMARLPSACQNEAEITNIERRHGREANRARAASQQLSPGREMTL